MSSTTSEERREAAAKLRALADGKSPMAECSVNDLYTALGMPWPRGGIEYAIIEYLADLIEQPEITEDTSDGYHTFEQLYYQRMVLFATLVQEHKDCAWKTWNHEDGKPCFGGGWFLVTIDTPKGAYGYHFEEKYWNLFDCPELPKAKHWDGYTEKDAKRLFSLNGYKVSDDDI